MGKWTRTSSPQKAALLAAIDDVSRTKTKVGWLESSVYADGTPVAYVASIQEYGDGPIPPRSFMRSTKDERGSQWSALMGKGALAVMRGNRTVEQVFTAVGLQAEGDIRAKIASIQSPPLSPITIKLRAYKKAGRKITGKTVGEASRDTETSTAGISTKPLVDDGYMLATLISITMVK